MCALTLHLMNSTRRVSLLTRSSTFPAARSLRVSLSHPLGCPKPEFTVDRTVKSFERNKNEKLSGGEGVVGQALEIKITRSGTAGGRGSLIHTRRVSVRTSAGG